MIIIVVAISSFLLLTSCTEPGIQGYEVVTEETPLNGNITKQLKVECPEGKKGLGAGWAVLDSTNVILNGQATYFQPAFDGAGWLVNARNESEFATVWKLRVRIICAKVND